MRNKKIIVIKSYYLDSFKLILNSIGLDYKIQTGTKNNVKIHMQEENFNLLILSHPEEFRIGYTKKSRKTIFAEPTGLIARRQVTWSLLN